MDKFARDLKGWLWIDALMAHAGNQESKATSFLWRGWLIERARTKRLRAELEAYREWADHEYRCTENYDGSECDCGLTGIQKRWPS